MGKCTACDNWNTVVEEEVRGRGEAAPSPGPFSPGESAEPLPITAVQETPEKRLGTGSRELDRVLGGGMVPGSAVLLGGDPGIGKSTLLLQVAWERAGRGHRVLYISGEESPAQLRLRGERLGALHDNLLVLAETDLEAMGKQLEAHAPELVIIDSIQTVYWRRFSSSPGSVAQVRECAALLAQQAKKGMFPLFLVGHVTKAGEIAGPRVLEHLVDAVLYLEGERHHAFRILRGVKNRFGSTAEIGVFQMGDRGMEEVENPSALFLSGRAAGAAGSVVVATLEGTRPLLVELQALVSESSFATPRRSATGIDYSRLLMLLAVLEKRVGLRLGDHDAYVNAVGGVRINEPAADLGLLLALASSFRDHRFPPDALALGEVGLTGEVRGVSRLSQRLKEAAHLGFRQCFVPRANLEEAGESPMEVIAVNSVAEALQNF